MGGWILSEPSVGIDTTWEDDLGKLLDLAGTLMAVFLVIALVALVAWVGVAVFASNNKALMARKVLGILTVVALSGVLVSMMAWMIRPQDDGGAGMGEIEIQAEDPETIDLEDREPKQWDVEDVQGGSDDDSPSSDEESPKEDGDGSEGGDSTDPPGGVRIGGCPKTGNGNNLLGAAAIGGGCDDE